MICYNIRAIKKLIVVADYAAKLGGKKMKNLLRSVLAKPMLLTKEKEVVATVLGYDYVTKNVVAKVRDTEASIALEDISIYQKAYKNKDQNINGDYLHKLLGSQIRCEVIGFDKGYILSRAKLMEKRSNKYNKGDIVEATVVNASDKALYLEFDEGLSGIMYINQLTSSKVNKPLDLYEIGDKIKCQIIKKNDEYNYFELSRLELYKAITLDLQCGKTITCKITQKLKDGTGYFVEVMSNPLYSGIFDLNVHNKNNKYVVGDSIRLRVVEIKGKQLRLRTCY